MAWADARYPRARRLPADWQKRRARVLRRDAGVCQIRTPGRCTHRATEVDHIVSGDNHAIDNLQAACRPCHSRKTALDAGRASGVVNHARAQSRFRPQERHPGMID